MEVKKVGEMWTVSSHITAPNGKREILVSYDRDRDKVIELHKEHLKNSDVVYYQTIQMHKEIALNENCASGDWPEEMRELSKKALVSLGAEQ